MLYFSISRQRKQRLVSFLSLMVLIVLLLSACGGDPKIRQQADQYRSDLDKAIAHDREIGVPDDLLKPILKQEAQLSATSAPYNLFSDQPTNDHYNNLAKRYHMLLVQTQGLASQTTQKTNLQAVLDLQDMEKMLSQRQTEGYTNTKTFADQLDQYRKLMNKAQYPKDYTQISINAKRSTQAMQLMGTAYENLTTLRDAIKMLQDSKADLGNLVQQEKDDTEMFRKASTPEDFNKVIAQINSQINSSSSISSQAMPAIGNAKIKQFQIDVDKMKQYGLDVTNFQKLVDDDQANLKNAKDLKAMLKATEQIDQHMDTVKMPLLKGQAKYLLQQFHQEVTTWGNSHQYNNSYDGKSYPLNYEYNVAQGFGGDLDEAVKNASTEDDYQSAITQINNMMFHLKLMEADYNDTTPWSQVHATDTQAIEHYSVGSGPVLVVSFIEQSLRYYRDGKLVRAFQVTTGQFERPSPPAFLQIRTHERDIVFRSNDSPNSPFYYRDTPINYAMLYRDYGFYFHDSYWRNGYGKGTNFPHEDPGSGNNGSHGCVNMAKDEIAWLFDQVPNGTPVILY